MAAPYRSTFQTSHRLSVTNSLLASARRAAMLGAFIARNHSRAVAMMNAHTQRGEAAFQPPSFVGANWAAGKPPLRP
jgi:hypothetical protein